jgi:hypothetical protein
LKKTGGKQSLSRFFKSLKNSGSFFLPLKRTENQKNVSVLKRKKNHGFERRGIYVKTKILLELFFVEKHENLLKQNLFCVVFA